MFFNCLASRSSKKILMEFENKLSLGLEEDGTYSMTKTSSCFGFKDSEFFKYNLSVKNSLDKGRNLTQASSLTFTSKGEEFTITSKKTIQAPEPKKIVLIRITNE